jgi:hypothetical protein
MRGVSIGQQVGEAYQTRDAALAAAADRQGNEAITQRDDGQFEVHEVTLTARAKDAVLNNTYHASDLDPSVVAFSVETERHEDGSYRYSESTIERGLANDEVYAGSTVTGEGAAAQYENPEQLIGQISQSDRLTTTSSDGHRCGANNMLATAIRQGPAAVQRIVDALKARNPALQSLNVQDSLTPREVGLIADAMYRSAAGRQTSQGLDGDQLVRMASQTGVAANAAFERVPQSDLGISGMADGETRMFLVRIDGQGSSPAGQGNHWVSITRRGDEFVSADSGRAPHQQTFSSASAAESWVQADLPTVGANRRPTDQAEMVRIPPQS